MVQQASITLSCSTAQSYTCNGRTNSKLYYDLPNGAIFNYLCRAITFAINTQGTVKSRGSYMKSKRIACHLHHRHRRRHHVHIYSYKDIVR